MMLTISQKQASALGLIAADDAPRQKCDRQQNMPTEARQKPVARREGRTIPRAERAERTGLSTFIKAGWSVQSPDSVQHRLYVINNPALDTGMCESEAAACQAARLLSKEKS